MKYLSIYLNNSCLVLYIGKKPAKYLLFACWKWPTRAFVLEKRAHPLKDEWKRII